MWPLRDVVPDIDAEDPLEAVSGSGTGAGGGGAGHVLDPAAADGDEDECVQPPWQYGVDGEEVAGERCSVLAQERAPVLLVTLGCRRNT